MVINTNIFSITAYRVTLRFTLSLSVLVVAASISSCVVEGTIPD